MRVNWSGGVFFLLMTQRDMEDLGLFLHMRDFHSDSELRGQIRQRHSYHNKLYFNQN